MGSTRWTFLVASENLSLIKSFNTPVNFIRSLLSRSTCKRRTSGGGSAADLRDSEDAPITRSSGKRSPTDGGATNPHHNVASGNDTDWVTPPGPAQAPHNTRASLKRKDRLETRHHKTRADEKVLKRQRRLKKKAARSQKARKINGSAAEEEEEGEKEESPVSDSNVQHSLQAAAVQRKLFLQPSSLMLC
jgi:hypothetical protein